MLSTLFTATGPAALPVLHAAVPLALKVWERSFRGATEGVGLRAAVFAALRVIVNQFGCNLGEDHANSIAECTLRDLGLSLVGFASAMFILLVNIYVHSLTGQVIEQEVGSKRKRPALADSACMAALDCALCMQLSTLTIFDSLPSLGVLFARNCLKLMHQ